MPLHIEVQATSSEPAPLLDVHVPHPTHTWRDFFIHIATIAIGLEQTVEAIHRQHVRQQLRESIHQEAEQVAHDCERVETSMTAERQFDTLP